MVNDDTGSGTVRVAVNVGKIGETVATSADGN